MRTKKEIEKAIENNKKYLKRNYKIDNYKSIPLDLTNKKSLEKSLKALMLVNKINTMNWIIGKKLTQKRTGGENGK